MPEMPGDPFLPAGLGEALKAMYELYAASIQAGFSEQQAMQLVVVTLQTIMGKTINK